MFIAKRTISSSLVTPRWRHCCSASLVSIVLGLAACSQTVAPVPVPSEAQIRRDSEEARSKTVTPASIQIRRVSGRPIVIRHSSPQPFDLNFEIDAPGRVVIQIEDEAGKPVSRQDLGPQDRGRVRAFWNVRTEAGEAVDPGVYRYRIELEHADGSRESFPADLRNEGEEVLVQQLRFNPGAKGVSYVLPQPSRVRVRTLLDGHPLLATLRDWTPQPAGRHQIDWDGRDASGLLDVSGNQKLAVRVDAYALPVNAIIVEPTGTTFPIRKAASDRADSESVYRHARHAPERCHEPRFALEFPGAARDSDDSPHRVSGEQTVRVSIDPDDIAHLLGGGFELMFFLDLVFLFEEEEGTNPFNFTLDARSLSPGLHFLTVNLLTYDDHAGVVTAPFWVE